MAKQYFEDGSVEAACPPLRALLEIMAWGHYQNTGADAHEIRALFRRETLLASDWYAERLRTKQSRDVALWTRHVAALETFLATRAQAPPFPADQRLAAARVELERVRKPAYFEELRGTIGADPFHHQMPHHS